MAELLRKNTLFCAALEDQYVKSEVYKPNFKNIYQLNLQKKHLCYRHGNETIVSAKFSSLHRMPSIFW